MSQLRQYFEQYFAQCFASLARQGQAAHPLTQQQILEKELKDTKKDLVDYTNQQQQLRLQYNSHLGELLRSLGQSECARQLAESKNIQEQRALLIGYIGLMEQAMEHMMEGQQLLMTQLMGQCRKCILDITNIENYGLLIDQANLKKRATEKALTARGSIEEAATLSDAQKRVVKYLKDEHTSAITDDKESSMQSKELPQRYKQAEDLYGDLLRGKGGVEGVIKELEAKIDAKIRESKDDEKQRNIYEAARRAIQSKPTYSHIAGTVVDGSKYTRDFEGGFLSADHPGFLEFREQKVPLRKVLAVLYLSATAEDVPDKESSLECLIQRLYEIQRAHNIDDSGNDDGRPDQPSCLPGAKGRLKELPAQNPKICPPAALQVEDIPGEIESYVMECIGKLSIPEQAEILEHWRKTILGDTIVTDDKTRACAVKKLRQHCGSIENLLRTFKQKGIRINACTKAVIIGLVEKTLIAVTDPLKSSASQTLSGRLLAKTTEVVKKQEELERQRQEKEKLLASCQWQKRLCGPAMFKFLEEFRKDLSAKRAKNSSVSSSANAEVEHNNSYQLRRG